MEATEKHRGRTHLFLLPAEKTICGASLPFVSTIAAQLHGKHVDTPIGRTLRRYEVAAHQGGTSVSEVSKRQLTPRHYPAKKRPSARPGGNDQSHIAAADLRISSSSNASPWQKQHATSTALTNSPMQDCTRYTTRLMLLGASANTAQPYSPRQRALPPCTLRHANFQGHHLERRQEHQQEHHCSPHSVVQTAWPAPGAPRRRHAADGNSRLGVQSRRRRRPASRHPRWLCRLRRGAYRCTS